MVNYIGGFRKDQTLKIYKKHCECCGIDFTCNGECGNIDKASGYTHCYCRGCIGALPKGHRHRCKTRFPQDY
jgi:hypothetical protein